MTIAQQINWNFETNKYLIIKDKNHNIIYIETSIYWAKREYDSNGNEIYYENSNGVIEDNRPKMSEVDELKHRLAMVKGDLDDIRTFIHLNGLDEKFQRPTKTSDDAWTLLNNIEIACDLSDTESLNWK